MGLRVSPELEAQILAMPGVVITSGALAAAPQPESEADQRRSEKAFQAAITKEAKRQGWLCYHTRISKGSTAGFPDLVLARERVIFAELKTETGEPTAEQEEWLARLHAAGCEVYLWRPSSWPEIENTLRQR